MPRSLKFATQAPRRLTQNEPHTRREKKPQTGLCAKLSAFRTPRKQQGTTKSDTKSIGGRSEEVQHTTDGRGGRSLSFFGLNISSCRLLNTLSKKTQYPRPPPAPCSVRRQLSQQRRSRQKKNNPGHEEALRWKRQRVVEKQPPHASTQTIPVCYGGERTSRPFRNRPNRTLTMREPKKQNST